MTKPPALLLLPWIAFGVLMLACSSGGSATPEPTATPQPSATQVAPPTATPDTSSDTPAQPGPQPGVACPVALVICEFAVRMETVFEAGDADAFFASAGPIGGTCTGTEVLGGPSTKLCEGAAPNEVRYGYWAIRGGESLVVTEQELRGAMVRWFDSIARAGSASDVYGSGELKIGSISCTRRPDQASGDCIGNSIQIHMTFINPENAEGTGIPGERISFHVSAGAVDGVLKANGFGTVVPPNRVLLPSLINVTDNAGKPLVVEIYPWTH